MTETKDNQTPQPSALPTIETQSRKPNYGLIALLVLLVIVVAVAAYKYWQKNNVVVYDYESCIKVAREVTLIYPAQCTYKGITYTQQQRPPIVPPQESLKDWKIYTNVDYGFSIDYPSDWEVKENGNDKSFIFVAPIKLGATFANTTKITIDTSAVQRGAAMDEPLNPSCNESTFATKTARECESQAENYYGKDIRIMDTTGTKWASNNVISVSIDSSNLGLKPIFLKIISTFKFTEPTSQTDTPGWKTYSNPQIGISFQYPTSLGEPKTEILESPQNPNVLSGKAIFVSFPAERPRLYIQTITDNYQNIYNEDTFAFGALTDVCSTEGADNSSSCRILNFGNNKVAWQNVFRTPECSPFFDIKVYLINPKSVYRLVKFDLTPIDIGALISKKYSCIDEKQEGEAWAEAERQSINIFTGKNLSERDKTDVELLKLILASVSFSK